MEEGEVQIFFLIATIILFLNIYINDLLSLPKCYVDDSQFYLSFPVRDATLAAEQLTEDLRNIAAWCCKNSLINNLDKTKLLVLGIPQLLMKPTNM